MFIPFPSLAQSKSSFQLGMVVHDYNTSTWKTRQVNCEFEVILGYRVRASYLKNNQKQKQKKDEKNSRDGWQ
jgi:hypothetical protein